MLSVLSAVPVPLAIGALLAMVTGFAAVSALGEEKARQMDEAMWWTFKRLCALSGLYCGVAMLVERLPVFGLVFLGLGVVMVAWMWMFALGIHVRTRLMARGAAQA